MAVAADERAHLNGIGNRNRVQKKQIINTIARLQVCVFVCLVSSISTSLFDGRQSIEMQYRSLDVSRTLVRSPVQFYNCLPVSVNVLSRVQIDSRMKKYKSHVSVNTSINTVIYLFLLLFSVWSLNIFAFSLFFLLLLLFGSSVCSLWRVGHSIRSLCDYGDSLFF